MKKLFSGLSLAPLTREIVLALVIKIAIIAALYVAFFDGQAIDPDADGVAARLVDSQFSTHP
jgi:hypothetical protein